MHLVRTTLLQRLMLSRLSCSSKFKLANSLLTSWSTTTHETIIHQRSHLIIEIILFQILCWSVFAVLGWQFLFILALFLCFKWLWYDIRRECTDHWFICGWQVVFVVLIVLLIFLLTRDFLKNLINFIVNTQVHLTLMPSQCVFNILHNIARDYTFIMGMLCRAWMLLLFL